MMVSSSCNELVKATGLKGKKAVPVIIFSIIYIMANSSLPLISV